MTRIHSQRIYWHSVALRAPRAPRRDRLEAVQIPPAQSPLNMVIYALWQWGVPQIYYAVKLFCIIALGWEDSGRDLR